MKKIIVSFALIISSLFAVAQKQPPPPTPPDMPIDTSTKLITYTDVVQAPGVQAAELYKRAKIWVYGFYKSPSTVIQKLDLVTNVFEGKSSIIIVKTMKDGSKSTNTFMNYSITLNFKDGKYRYKITNLNVKDLSYHPAEKLSTEKDMPTLAWNCEILKQTDDSLKDIIQKMKNGMAKPSNAVKNDNW